MDSIIVLLLLSTLRVSLPLLFAAMGGYFSEKSGVAQIALEAYLLIGAFTAASVAYFTKSLVIGYLAAAVITMLFSQIFSALVLKFKGNSIVIGTGLNLLAMGIIPILSKSIFNSTGSTPSLELSGDSPYFPYIVLVLTFAVAYWLSEKTIWGLQMKFAGEKKLALQSVGINPLGLHYRPGRSGAFYFVIFQLLSPDEFRTRLHCAGGSYFRRLELT